MRERGLDPVLLAVLRDIDLIDDLSAAVADMPPTSQLASVVRDLTALVSS